MTLQSSCNHKWLFILLMLALHDCLFVVVQLFIIFKWCRYSPPQHKNDLIYEGCAPSHFNAHFTSFELQKQVLVKRSGSGTLGMQNNLTVSLHKHTVNNNDKHNIPVYDILCVGLVE